MKRPTLIVLLAALVTLAGWAVAQPPASKDQEGPPVRLKRKKQRPVQEEPAARPEKKVEQPDPVEEPKKKPDGPQKPKLDEEERLDPKDDLKLPAGEEKDEREILDRVARNARTSEERITNRELGESTRTLQQEILKDIDSLIEQAKNQDDQDDQNANSEDQQTGAGGSKGKMKPRWVTQRRRPRQGARRRPQGNESAGNTRPNQGQETGNNPGGGGSGGGAKEKPPDRAFDRWGHLPEKERALMQKEMEQKFMDKYDDLTKQYYRIIAEKSRRKK